MTDAQRATAYRKLRAENERLYQRGFLAGNPSSSSASEDASPSNWFAPKFGPNPYPPGVLPPRSTNQSTNTPPDMWRDAGRYLSMAPLVLAGGGLPLTLTPEALMGGPLTTNAYQTLHSLRRQLGTTE